MLKARYLEHWDKVCAYLNPVVCSILHGLYRARGFYLKGT